jgi:hypothetical protein
MAKESIAKFSDIIAMYKKHGWQLVKVLITPETGQNLKDPLKELLPETPLKEASIDALWFKRNSSERREAWELRLVADTPFALFETFEEDESEEEREERRQEMEAELRERIMVGVQTEELKDGDF